MGLPDVGKDADGGVDDLPQAVHLAGLGDAGLEDGQLVGVVHLPHGEGHTYLGVVAAGAGDGFAVVGDHLHNPVFDNGLAVAAGDAHHGDAEPGAPCGNNLLEGDDDVFDKPEVGSGAERELLEVFFGGIVGDDEVAHTAQIEVIDIAAAGVALGGDGKEEAASGVAGAAAVGKELVDVEVVGADMCSGTLEDGCYFAWFQFVMILYPMRQWRQSRWLQ